MEECRICYAQVSLDALGGHMMWHNQQRQIMELCVKNLEGALDLIERMSQKVHLPRGPR